MTSFWTGLTASMGTKRRSASFHSLSTIIPLLSFSRLYSALVFVRPAAMQARRKPGRTPFGCRADGPENPASRKSLRDKRGVFPTFFATFRPSRGSFPVCGNSWRRTTLRPAADGKEYELRCPPDYEAQLMGLCKKLLSPYRPRLLSPCPIKIIGADPTPSLFILADLGLVPAV